MWVRRSGFRVVMVAVSAIVVLGGCSVFSPDVSFEESSAQARANAEVVADVIGDAADLDRVRIGPRTCGFSNRYADLGSYLALGSTPGEAELDRIAEVIGELGFTEDSREDFAVGPYRLWVGDDDLTISVTVITDENAVGIKTRGPCARAPE